MLIRILIAVAVIVVVFVIVVATRRADFRIVRAASIAAPPAVVFAQVNDFHNWRAWSPWEKVNPVLKRTYEGAPAGTGAVYTWAGDKVGEGRMTLIESRPNDLIRIRLEFYKPFAATNTAEFIFEPQGDSQTAVTWSVTGRNKFVGRAFCMFMNMDKKVGGQFEEGLAKLKSVAEADSKGKSS